MRIWFCFRGFNCEFVYAFHFPATYGHVLRVPWYDVLFDDGISRIKRFIKYLPSSISNAMSYVILNHFCLLRSSRRRRSGISQSSGCDYLGAVWSILSLFHFFRSHNFSGITKERVRFTPPPLIRRLAAVRITDIVGR